MELALDTSTATAGVAVAERGRLLAELTWRAGQQHTTQLYAAIEHVLKLAGTTPQGVTAIVVAIGPGTFSGLRVGVSAAKGFALANDLPLAAVSTMAVEAYPFAAVGLPIRPILDAGRGEVAVGHFAGESELETPRILTLEALCAEIQVPTLFCGEQLPLVAERLRTQLGQRAVLPPFAAAVRRPGNLAELGWRRLAAGQREDIATLQPNYLRAPSITPPKARAAVKSGKEKSS